MDKKVWRERLRKKRKMISKNITEKQQLDLLEQLKELLASYEYIASYSAIIDEISTQKLNEWIFSCKKLYLPRVKECHKEMEMVRVDGLSEKYFEIGAYNILEPVGEAENERIEVIIVPGIAFTHRGERIGYGQGYYDRYLAAQSKITIGITWEAMMQEYLPIEAHDQILDYIVTEKKIYSIKKE